MAKLTKTPINDPVIFDAEENPYGIKRKVFKNSDALKDEIYGRITPEKVVDLIEEHNGTKPKTSKSEVIRGNRLLEPENGNDDSEFLNELLNDPAYSIVMYKDNWTKEGSYQVFVIYEQKISESKKNLVTTA